MLALAVFATDAVADSLPPLAIDTDALRGAITACAGALLLGGFMHLGVIAGLRASRPRAVTAGILLSTVLAALFLALAAAAFTSAAAEPMHWLPWLASGAGATVVTGAYAVSAAGLVTDLRAGSVR
jgi:heme/copper-type cytochrome/quinol oxidase subunit 3